MADYCGHDKGGAYATRLLKNHLEYRHIPVLLFSATHDLPFQAELARAHGYVAKPFDMRDLKAVIQEHLLKAHAQRLSAGLEYLQ